MKELGRERTIRIYLPPGYEKSNKRFPVLYMHDGQNLFDDATSYVGDWGVDESLDALAREGIELFVVGSELIVNELAPRPHNSGHYSIDACETSQFEQHIRAICGLPLGETRLTTPVVMANILGQHITALDEALPMLSSRTKVHLYGKQDAKQGRKMGHLNILADSVEEALAEVARLQIWKETVR